MKRKKRGKHDRTYDAKTSAPFTQKPPPAFAPQQRDVKEERKPPHAAHMILRRNHAKPSQTNTSPSCKHGTSYHTTSAE